MRLVSAFQVGNFTRAGKLEGGGQVFEVEVVLPQGAQALQQAVTVKIETQDGPAGPTGATSAGQNADYTAKNENLTFAIGAQGNDLRQLVTVSTQGDSEVEKDETFTLRLSNPNNATIGTPTAIGVIRNNDVDILMLDLTAAEGTRAEPTLVVGGIETARANGLRVVISASTSNGVGAQGATAPGDYTAIANSITSVTRNGQVPDPIKIHSDNDVGEEFFLYSIMLVTTGANPTSPDVQVNLTGGTCRITIPN